MSKAINFKNLTGLGFEGLAAAYGHANDRAVAADPRSPAVTLWVNRREAVVAECDRRGLIIRRSFSGEFMVGRKADFEPILAVR